MVTSHAYGYAGGSAFDEPARALGLATSGGTALAGPSAHPFFYRGNLPATAAPALLAVTRVAATDYRAQPPVAYRDPVVTCSGDRLRFESFSVCCGVYARLDVLSDALQGEVIDRGTTNVDVNEPLRRLLARVTDGDPLHLSVGSDRVVVGTLDGVVEERQVPLPPRWLRSFAETQVITAGFDLRAELSIADATRFLRSLPRNVRGTQWATPNGRSLRLSGRPSAGAVCLSGLHRIEALLPLLRHATALRVYGPSVHADSLPCASAWELELGPLRLVLVLSPQVDRAMSGEGAVLDGLLGDPSDADLVGALLAFEPRIEVGELATRSGLPPERVRTAITRLGTAGRVGYDLAEGAYFHRELPFDEALVESANPRLANAKGLVAAGAVVLDGADAVITVDGRERRVSGNTCTCTWWAEFQGTRGKCKHVLAADIVRGQA